MTTRNSVSSSYGFTLIELSIVMVIIGLIIGGVLIGKDMIKAAELRATVAQYEQFNTAMYNFKGKYNGIPGDLANAATFGFTPATTNSAVIAGDERIQSMGVGSEASALMPGFETTLFWQHLAAANLINGSFTSATGGAATNLATADLPNYFPAAKIGQGNYWTIYSAGGMNYYVISAFTGTTGVGSYRSGDKMTPIDALVLDTKIDDGLPATGMVRGIRPSGGTNGFGSSCILVGGGDACCGDNAGGATNMYKTVTSTLAGTPACSITLQVR